MTRAIQVAVAALAMLAAGSMHAPAVQLAQAVLVGEWAASLPCATSASRLRFAGNTLAFFSGAERNSEYEVEVSEAGDRVTVRIVNLIYDPTNRGLELGSALEYRRAGEDLRFVGMALPGGGYMSPNIATLYQRCK